MDRLGFWARVRAVVLIVLATLTASTALSTPATAAPDAEGWRTVVQYAPSVFLYSTDSYRPATTADFLSHSNLRWAHDQSCADHELAARGHVDVTRLGTGGYQHQTASAWPFCDHHDHQYRSTDFTRPRGGVVGGEGFFLDLDNAARHGVGRAAPVYFEYQAHKFVTYWFFYAFNNAPLSVADHEGDWERISVRLDSNNQATQVAYYIHASYCTVPWSDVASPQSHPVAYSADGTHASYPTAGAHGLDDTDQGPQWHTWANLQDVRDQAWYGYGGGWGEVGDTEASTGPVGPSPYKSPAPTDWAKPC